MGETANAAMPRLLRNTRPFESVPKIESSVPVAPSNGWLPDSRIGCVGSGAPPAAEPVAFVLVLMNPPKSGLALRLLPVSVACEIA